MKSSPELEQIFSTAVALDQSGRLRNTIYCFGNTVFILNGDGTVLLKFTTPRQQSEFKSPISFRANDYEPGNFNEKDGQVIFTKTGDEFQRSKYCKTPEKSFADIQAIWNGLQSPAHSTISIHKKSLALMEEDLSHLEFQSKNKSIEIVQRDIFSGTTITLTRNRGQGLQVASPDKIIKDFGPVGIRTNDFMALYSFRDMIEFGVPDKPGFLTVKSGDMLGIIANCIYDEMGTVEVIENGREIKENRRSIESPNRPPCVRRPIQQKQ